MTPAAIVRAAEVHDAEAIVDVHGAAWDAALGVLVGRRLGQLAPRDQRVERMQAGIRGLPDDAAVLVGEMDGRIVAMGVVRRPSGADGEVRDLYVAPEAWGTGVAALLLDRMVTWLRERGAASAGLWVVAENSRARRFYEREGWRADGPERATELGPPEIRYRRELEEE